MKNIKLIVLTIVAALSTSVWADTAVFEGDNLNVSGGAKTVGSIQLSVPASNGMTWSNNSLYASGSNKFFHLDATGGASISKVLITMNITSNRYQASNITGCTSCTKDGSVYTCEFSTPQSSIDFKNNGGGVGITKLEVTYSTSGGGDQGGGDQGGGDQGGGDQGGGEQGGGDTPTPSGNSIFDWVIAGSSKIENDNTDLSQASYGTLKVGTSVAGRILGSNAIDYNSKGYKLGNNDVCIEIQGTSAFQVGDVVTITGVCGGDGARAFAIASSSVTNASNADTALTNAINGTTVSNFTVTVKEKQIGDKLRIFRLAGKTMYLSAIKVERGGDTPTPPTPVTVESVSLNKKTLSLEAGKTETLTATVKPDDAENQNISWSSDNTTVATVDATGKVSALVAGTANIVVKTEDQEKTDTCKLTVTAPAAPIEVQSISIKSATTISIGASETLSVTYTPADANTGKAITWTSDKTDIATVDANGQVKGVAAGTAVITATSEKGKTATCTVTVQAVAVTGVTLNKTSLSIKEAETAALTATVQPTNATNKKVTWSSDKTSVATVNANGVVTGVAQGSATITVTTEDGNKTATCAVTVTEASTVPQTNLSLHVPEIYEASEMAGGYGGTLAEVGGREYEVYYASYDGKDSLSVTVSPVRKTDGITYNPNKQKLACKANDGWFEMSTTESKSDFSMSATEEFKAGSTAVHKLKNGSGYEFHIQGFDQFSFYGKENSSAGRNFEMYLDDTLKTMTKSTTASIRRFDISTREHVIRVIGIGSSNEEFYGFSLRVAQEPRTKWLTGNDSTQAVRVSDAIKPVTYVTKYNNIAGAETKLEWLGTPVEGIALQKIDGELTDTLLLSGTPNAPAGEYRYAIVTYYNGVETSRAEGKFYIKYDIKALTETNIEADQNEEMDEIKFKYYVYDETTDIIFQWTPEAGLPGVTTSAKNGSFTISGTPTAQGKYSYLITVTGGDTITGVINVQSSDLGVDPILYLYKNALAFEKDYIYTYLKQSGYNLREKRTKDDLRAADQYAKYKWVLISEDVDANNPEVFKILRGGAHLPILNMKAFTYSHSIDSLTADSLDYPYDKETWGEANNGSLSENGKSITVLRDDHPIFKALGKKQGDRIQILDSIERRGLMPISVKKQGSLCLATAWTRDLENYFGDGVQETFLHEIPAGRDGGNTKYICFPIAMNSCKYLTNDGKNLLKKTIDYLLNNEATVQPVNPEITSFFIEDIEGVITPGSPNTILVEIDSLEHPDINLKAVAPKVTVASPYTHTVPEMGDTVDLSTAEYLPYNYVVTDYIKRVVYEVTIVWRKAQGIEEVYTVGNWVNIYDIFGRKVATTNENIYTMSLPRGIYIIVTENGQTLKITR